MNTTCEKIASNKVKLSFTVPAEQVDEALHRAYLKVRGRVNVPGFRKGKAPRKIIENMYGEKMLFDEALEMLFPDAYSQAVEESGIKTVDTPSVDVDSVHAGQSVTFTAEVYVRPEVTLGQYKGLTIKEKMWEVTDEQIEASINNDREKLARMIDITERPVKEGDIVTIDYAGTMDNTAFDGGTATNHELLIGSHSFIPGFEEQLIGMEKDSEADISVTFPSDYHAAELAGKEAVFHVKVNGIQEKELPEPDDAFAQDISEYDCFADYKNHVRDELCRTAEKNYHIRIENALVEAAVSNASVDIPDAMIQDEINMMIRDLELRLLRQGLKLDDYIKFTGQTIESMREMYQADAERRVKTELVVDAIKEQETIVPTPEEIRIQMEREAQRAGEPLESFEQRLTDRQKEYITISAAAQKTVEFMRTECIIETEEKPAKKKQPRKKAAAKKTDKEEEADESDTNRS